MVAIILRKPVSLGFANPRRRRSFITEMNSLLLNWLSSKIGQFSSRTETNEEGRGKERKTIIMCQQKTDDSSESSELFLPLSSKSVKTTSTRWSDSSTFATVFPTCFKVAAQQHSVSRELSSKKRGKKEKLGQLEGTVRSSLVTNEPFVCHWTQMTERHSTVFWLGKWNKVAWWW